MVVKPRNVVQQGDKAMAAKAKEVDIQLQEGLADAAVVKIYSNGFTCASGNGDVVMMLQQNGQPVAVVNMSFTVAKTLALKLGELIRDFENKANTTILTTSDIDEAFKSSNKVKIQ